MAAPAHRHSQAAAHSRGEIRQLHVAILTNIVTSRVPPYTITYFAVRGRCGAMRLLLSDQGQEWKTNIISFDDWKKGDLKSTCMFGQLPKFEDGDLVLFQSHAIVKHLGRKHGLYGKDDTEAAYIDMMVDGVEDLWLKYARMVYHEYRSGELNYDKKDIGHDEYIKELPDHLSKFEAILSKKKSGFLVGDKVSIADYTLFEVLLNHRILCSSCLDSFPALKSFVEKMSARPKIKAYLESDAYKKLPIDMEMARSNKLAKAQEK